jgi:sterol desaturase/sphingolipid hydroxylase (fatty acid hydroxylase superfamily)
MLWGWVLTPLCGRCYRRRQQEGSSVFRHREGAWPVHSWQYTLALLIGVIVIPMIVLVGVPALWSTGSAVAKRSPFDSPYFWLVWSIWLLAAVCLYYVATRLYSYVRFERPLKRA